jgi:hypothetical protein
MDARRKQLGVALGLALVAAAAVAGLRSLRKAAVAQPGPPAGAAAGAQPGAAAGAAARGAARISDKLTAPAPEPWLIMPARMRNLIELVLPATAQRPETERVRVAITTEARTDHAEAVKRLKQIAAERRGQLGYVEICGWPALERRATVELARPLSERNDGQEMGGPPEQATVVTVAVAAGEQIVRYEGTMKPGAPPAEADQVAALERKLECAAKPPAGQTPRDLKALKATLGTRAPPSPAPRRPPAGKGKPGGELLRSPKQGERRLTVRGKAVPLAPSFLMKGRGELQIAVSDDGSRVFIGGNNGNVFSSDFGATFANSAAIPWGFTTRGDPSVGVGKSGNFYIATLGRPPAGCTASVATSSDGGNNFTGLGAAALCGNSPNNCLPDQEQMAVDRARSSVTGQDLLYMVWRNFPGPGPAVPCASIGPGTPTPLISCSQDGGANWGNQTVVGTGDIGRVAVGRDGSVYVTYLSGSNLMINKFSSCALGLVPAGGKFPAVVATVNGVTCPVAGLDRCLPAVDASPQPAPDDTSADHVFVAYADTTGGGNEDIVVRESKDGGATWPGQVTMNSAVAARRFLPWMCVSKGVGYVTWYDRRASTANAPDLTAYFVNFTKAGAPLRIGAERNVSGVNDPECASGWPCSVDNLNDSNGCPAGTSTVTGTCQLPAGGGSGLACTPGGPACATPGEVCQAGGGCPKYGDYNGNACMRGIVYVGWASATPPAGLAAPGGINVYTDRLNYADCGAQGQECCLQGPSACVNVLLACDATLTCVPCGASGAPCCGAGVPCQGNLACTGGVCACGGKGQPCCEPGDVCDPNLTCADTPGDGLTCQCGRLGQACCGGAMCGSPLLACVGGKCLSACGHQAQVCCHSPATDQPPSHAGPLPGWCYAGATCVGDTCVCGGKNQPCCMPHGSCNAGLTCANLRCIQEVGPTCAQCSANMQACLQRCQADPPHEELCDCLCHNTECDCRNRASCGFCPFQACRHGP